MIKCKLREQRLKFNDFNSISQDDLSKITGIRKQTISDMENHHTKSYSAENLNKLCEALNCQLSDIIEYVPEQESQQEYIYPISMENEKK